MIEFDKCVARLRAATDNARALLRDLDEVGAWFDERAFVVVDSQWREVE